MEPVSGFDALGLHPDLLATLNDLGYEAPTPVQRSAIPAMLTGSDLLCRAATGTGKTAAFALPIISRLPSPRGSSPVALVIAPTRELCMQVADAVHRYGRAFGARTLPVYGGQPIGRQLTGLRRGVDIVIATPGRAVDLLNRGALNLDDVTTVVLDEADEMLDMGFAEELEAILSRAPADRQTVMFSATMPKRIRRIADTHLRDPLTIDITGDPADRSANPAISQRAYVVDRAHKVAALCRILDVEAPEAALVFCRTRAEVDQLTDTLNGRGYRAEGLHGGMDQPARDRVMGRLRSGQAELLVATDVAARGLDVDHLTHVLNYDVPADPQTFVHRVGRVGRGGRSGTAITIAEPRERRQLATIERVTGLKVGVARLPTSAELRQRRLAATQEVLAAHLDDADLGDYREVVAGLDDADLQMLLLAAVKVAHLATVGEAGEGDIPDASERTPKSRRTAGEGARGERSGQRRGREDQPVASGKKRIVINAGRDAGIRPADVVGAIANETGLSGSQIGPIAIRSRVTTVDVPAGAAREVIDALGRTRVKGVKVKARKDRGQER